MLGVKAILSGRGTDFYKAMRLEFQKRMPKDFPFVFGTWVRFGKGDLAFRKATDEELRTLPHHPAYGGRFEHTRLGMDYRRANACHGPMPRESGDER